MKGNLRDMSHIKLHIKYRLYRYFRASQIKWSLEFKFSKCIYDDNSQENY